MLGRRCWELPHFGSSECCSSSLESPFFWIPSSVSRCKVSVRLRRSLQHAFWSSAVLSLCAKSYVCGSRVANSWSGAVFGSIRLLEYGIAVCVDSISSFSSTKSLSCGRVTDLSMKNSARTSHGGFRVCDPRGASQNKARQRTKKVCERRSSGPADDGQTGSNRTCLVSPDKSGNRTPGQS